MQSHAQSPQRAIFSRILGDETLQRQMIVGVGMIQDGWIELDPRRPQIAPSERLRMSATYREANLCRTNPYRTMRSV